MIRVQVAVADASVLNVLGASGHLDLLDLLAPTILVPPAVRAEVTADPRLPGAVAFAEALSTGRLDLAVPSDGPRLAGLRALLDPGEAEAIALAVECSARWVLMDDKAGRRAACSQGLTPLGTAGIVLLAARKGRVEDLAALLDTLMTAGLYLSQELREAVLAAGGPSGP